MRILGLSRVSRNNLKGLAEGLILAAGLLVPLCSRSSVGSLGFNTCCRRCGRLLSLRSANSRRSSVELCQACVRGGGVRDCLRRLCLGSGGLGLRDVVYPGLLGGEGSLLKRGLLDL